MCVYVCVCVCVFVFVFCVYNPTRHLPPQAVKTLGAMARAAQESDAADPSATPAPCCAFVPWLRSLIPDVSARKVQEALKLSIAVVLASLFVLIGTWKNGHWGPLTVAMVASDSVRTVHSMHARAHT